MHKRKIIVVILATVVWCWPAGAQAFGLQQVIEKAKTLAANPYEPPPSIPPFLANLDYDEYQQIRFRPQDSLWRQSNSNFQVMLIAPGEYFRHPVRIHTVAADGVHAVAFDKSHFTWPDKELAAKVPSDLGYAGLKLTYPINQPGSQDQFLVFAGASYFRAVARGENFGLSARGIAIDTGLPGGEEFPDFTDFWLVRPRPDAHALRLYALLNGPSLTGAYRFVVFPGAPTRIEVRAVLFLRKPVKLLGFAPLTSMFFYGSNTPRPAGQWRPAVHDSQGLLIHSGTGEWLWRPLINPLSLQMDYFEANSPQGFGLLQRTVNFRAYQDLEARYDRRPSAWVEPRQDWGAGHVVLVEIPTDSETNDNVVAFWSPDAKTSAGGHYDLQYTLTFGSPRIPDEPMAQAKSTFVGRGTAPAGSSGPVYRVVVDFGGGPLDRLPANAPISAVVTGLEGTQVLSQTTQWVKPLNQWRLSLLAAPAPNGALKLRAFLKSGENTLSETWTYGLPAQNRVTGHS